MSVISKTENHSTIDSSHEIFESFFNSKTNSLFSHNNEAFTEEEINYTSNNIYNLEHPSFGPTVIIESEPEHDNCLFNIYDQIDKTPSNDNTQWNFDDMFVL